MNSVTVLMAGIASLRDDLESADVDWATNKITGYELAIELNRIVDELIDAVDSITQFEGGNK